mgnify:CR=1 FL=1
MSTPTSTAKAAFPSAKPCFVHEYKATYTDAVKFVDLLPEVASKMDGPPMRDDGEHMYGDNKQENEMGIIAVSKKRRHLVIQYDLLADKEKGGFLEHNLKRFYAWCMKRPEMRSHVRMKDPVYVGEGWTKFRFEYEGENARTPD